MGGFLHSYIMELTKKYIFYNNLIPPNTITSNDRRQRSMDTPLLIQYRHATNMPKTVSDTPHDMPNKVKEKYRVITVSELLICCFKKGLNGLQNFK